MEEQETQPKPKRRHKKIETAAREHLQARQPRPENEKKPKTKETKEAVAGPGKEGRKPELTHTAQSLAEVEALKRQAWEVFQQQMAGEQDPAKRRGILARYEQRLSSLEQHQQDLIDRDPDLRARAKERASAMAGGAAPLAADQLHVIIDDLLADIIQSDNFAISAENSEATERYADINFYIEQLPDTERAGWRRRRDSVVNIHDAWLHFDKHIAEGITEGFRESYRFKARYLNEVFDLPGVAQAWKSLEKWSRRLIDNTDALGGGWDGANPFARFMSEKNWNDIWSEIANEIGGVAGDHAEAYTRLARGIWEYMGRFDKLSAHAFRQALSQGAQLTAQDFEGGPRSYGGKHFQFRRILGFDVWAYVEGIERIGPAGARQIQNIITNEVEHVRGEFQRALDEYNANPPAQVGALPVCYGTNFFTEWSDFLPEEASRLRLRNGDRLDFDPYNQRYFEHNNPYLNDLPVDQIDFSVLVDEEFGHWGIADGAEGADATRRDLTGRKEGEGVLFTLHTEPMEVWWKSVKGSNSWSHLSARYGEGRKFEKWFRMNDASSKLQDENLPPRGGNSWKDAVDKLLPHGFHWGAIHRTTGLPYVSIEHGSGVDDVVIARLVLGFHDRETILAFDHHQRELLMEEAQRRGNWAEFNALRGEDDDDFLNWFRRLALGDPAARNDALRLRRIQPYHWDQVFPYHQAMLVEPLKARVGWHHRGAADMYFADREILAMIDEMEFQEEHRLLFASEADINDFLQRFNAGESWADILAGLGNNRDLVLDQPPPGEGNIDRRIIAHEDGLAFLADTDPDRRRQKPYHSRLDYWPMERRMPKAQIERAMATFSPENPSNERVDLLPTPEDWKEVVLRHERELGPAETRRLLDRLGYHTWYPDEWVREIGGLVRQGRVGEALTRFNPFRYLTSPWDLKNFAIRGGVLEDVDNALAKRMAGGRDKMPEKFMLIPRLNPIDIFWAFGLTFLLFGGPLTFSGITWYIFSSWGTRFGFPGGLARWWAGRSKFAPSMLRVWRSPYKEDPRLYSELEKAVFGG